MLKIRLTRRGKKNSAFFRIVVAEHTAPIKGGFLEVLGFLNPHTKEKNFKTDRIQHWIEKGAQCSDTVHNLLVANNIVKAPKRAVKLKKKPIEPASAEASASSADKSAAEGKKKVEASIEASTEASMEKKSAEAKPEPASAKGSGEAKEEKKEVEAAKPEPEKKEDEKKESEEKK